jgi:hypothetical protein
MQAIWRLMIVLGLLAAIGGTPLRLVEAADDLARALADLDEPDDLEPSDPGVGDDSGVAPWKAGATLPPCPATIGPPSPLLARASSCLDRLLHAFNAQPSGPAPRRLAWLQALLF